MSHEKVIQAEKFRQMQLLQLDMIAELDKVCRNHGIKWYADMGTLIGAIRHKGYIPWDDDLDISILFDD